VAGGWTRTARDSHPEVAEPPTEQVPAGTDTGADQTTANTAADHKTARVNRRWDQFVHDAIIGATARPFNDNEWMGMTELRAALDARGTTRVAQDDQLKRMSIDGTIILVPESNRKMLTDADRAAAVRIGGDDCHVVCWGEGHHRLSPEQ
jgi:hypothetical protein